ncbi:MAG: hypothetical protein Q8R10_05880 [Pseudomonas sp.]|uniref:hypothetical protein n=1 Tax=Pseudomonas sp. TaxID=306 RepID=UPI002732BB97|nr:hypothetical protein [Pseudomonas sp.]MDP3845939.1 hypothetical protein [Pseudomonas sp.]
MAAMEYLHSAGLAVEVIGGNLRLSPADRITDAVRVFVRDHKPELLAEAAAEPLPASAWLWLLLMTGGEIIQLAATGTDQRSVERLARRDHGDDLAQVIPMPGLTNRLTGSELERFRAGLPIVRTPAPAPANLWLARVARHLGVRLAELMQAGLLTDDDVTECAGADPAEVAALIRSNPAWINRARQRDHVEQPLQLVDQHDGEPQHPIHTAATAPPEWIAARDQFNGHLSACKACYAPKHRYCVTGADLRQRYNSTAMEPTQ